METNLGKQLTGCSKKKNFVHTNILTKSKQQQIKKKDYSNQNLLFVAKSNEELTCVTRSLNGSNTNNSKFHNS